MSREFEDGADAAMVAVVLWMRGKAMKATAEMLVGDWDSIRPRVPREFQEPGPTESQPAPTKETR